jgi:hypothetical protein
MTPYNTGKVLIGSAYTPRIKPEGSHALSGPHTRRDVDRSVAYWVVACAALLCVVLRVWG